MRPIKLTVSAFGPYQWFSFRLTIVKLPRVIVIPHYTLDFAGIMGYNST